MTTTESQPQGNVEEQDVQLELASEQYYQNSREYNETRSDDEKELREELKAILIPLASEVVVAKGIPIPTDIPFQRAHGEPLHRVHALKHRTPAMSLNPKKYTGLGHVMETEVKAVGPNEYVIDRINIHQVNIETEEPISKKSDFHIGPAENFVKDYTTGNADSAALRIAIHTVRRMASELPDYQPPQDSSAS